MLATLATSAATSMGKLVPDPEKAAEVTTMMQPMAKVYQGIGLQSAILFVMSALLLAIGIGQLRYRAWAQRWSVYWGAAGLACVGLMVAISLLIIAPAYAEFFESMSHIKPQGGGQASVPSMGPMAGMFGGTFAAMSVIVYGAVPGADAAVLHARSRARVDDPLASWQPAASVARGRDRSARAERAPAPSPLLPRGCAGARWWSASRPAGARRGTCPRRRD